MWARRTAAREGAVSTMTANQSPVEPRPDVPDPTVDRTLPEEEVLRRRAMDRLKKKADFRMHLLIYVLVNSALVVIWAITGSGFFWPAFFIVGGGHRRRGQRRGRLPRDHADRGADRRGDGAAAEPVSP